LKSLGFLIARQSGSHMIYKNPEGKRATVPFHAAKVLHPKVPEKHHAGCGPERGRLGKTTVALELGGAGRLFEIFLLTADLQGAATLRFSACEFCVSELANHILSIISKSVQITH
jgi:hypothetical protein